MVSRNLYRCRGAEALVWERGDGTEKAQGQAMSPPRRLASATRRAASRRGRDRDRRPGCPLRPQSPRRDPAEVNARPPDPPRPPPPRPFRPERGAPARVSAARVPMSGPGRRSRAGTPRLSVGVTGCGSGLQGEPRGRNRRGCGVRPLRSGNRVCGGGTGGLEGLSLHGRTLDAKESFGQRRNTISGI